MTVVTGGRQIQERLKNILSGIDRDASAGVEEVAEDILEKSNVDTPVKTGKLRASGRTVKNRDGSVTIVYGNAEVDYAGIVHEDMESKHDVGQSKFLEKTGDEEAPNIPPKVARRIQSGLGR